MIKSQTIIQQLQAVLPLHTSLFTNTTLNITSLTISGTTVTATSDAPHGLSTGDAVNIKGAKTPIDVSSLTFEVNDGVGVVSGIVTAVTATDHDFTRNQNTPITSSNYENVTMTGADQEIYNGDFPISNVPNRRTVKYAVSTTPVSPATGTPKILYEYSWAAGGYNGIKTITVTSPTTFTYEVTQTITNDAQGTITGDNGIRISGAVTVEKAAEAYTIQETNELWGFVVLHDNIVSKDRHVSTDAVSTLSAGDAYRQRVIVPFSVYVITPTTGSIAARAEVDLMIDVKVALFKSLLGVKFDNELAESTVYVCTYTNDNFLGFNGAYYIHEFGFQTVVDITIGDTIDPAYNVAFRDINLNFLDPNTNDGDNIIMQTPLISLDDTPL